MADIEYLFPPEKKRSIEDIANALALRQQPYIMDDQSREHQLAKSSAAALPEYMHDRSYDLYTKAWLDGLTGAMQLGGGALAISSGGMAVPGSIMAGMGLIGLSQAYGNKKASDEMWRAIRGLNAQWKRPGLLNRASLLPRNADQFFDLRLCDWPCEIQPHAAFARRQAVVLGTVGNAA